MDGELHHATFVVRVSWDGEGTVAGIVERVRTGAKTSFRGPDAAGLILVRMIADDMRGARGEEGRLG